MITLFASAALARKAPSKITFGFALLALAGLLLVIGHGDPLTVFRGGINGGDLLVLLGTISFVGYTLGARRFSDWSALRYTALSAPLGTITVVAVTEIATLAGWYAAPSIGDVGAIWWQMLYVIAIGALAAVLAWNEGVRRLGAPNAALFMNLVPVVAFAIAIGRGYHPDAAELGGAALTVAALIGANLAARQETARPVRAAWATDALGEPREVARVERLRPVAQRRLGVLVDLDDDAVGADGRRGAGERLDQPPVAGRVAGIDDHGQVRVQLQPRHR